MAVAAESQPPVVVNVAGVSKKFVIRRDNSLKERLVTLGRLGRRHREEFWALRNIDLSITAGTTIGLIGHNGSGKSTLLKVIGGILDPTNGSVQNRGRIAALLELGAGFHPDLTGRENVYLNASILGLSRSETDDRFDEILSFSGIGDFIDSQVKFYSSGMYVRLAFAVAVHTDPDILLVDEVLAVGDEAFQRKCLDKIRSFQAEGRTIILVTHSLGQVIELCDRAVLLNRGEIVIDGDPREAVAAFRDILEDRRVAEIKPEEVASSAIELDSATATPAQPGPNGELLIGGDLHVDLTFSSEIDMTGLDVALQADSTSGQVVWGSSTMRMHVPLPALLGTNTLRFTLTNTNFGPGKFFFNIAVMDGDGVQVRHWPLACSFSTHDYLVTYGVVHMEPQFTILGAP